MKVLGSRLIGGSGSVTVPFTDGDTFRRVTVSDTNVAATSLIYGTIQRLNVADSADPGWIYVANIASVGAGSFDVLIAALDWGGEATEATPNESIIYVYRIG